MTIGVVLGTRPEIIKNWSIVKDLSRRRVPFLTLHTGQQIQDDMCRDIFDAMGYEPDLVLPGSYSFGVAVDWVMKILQMCSIDTVVVNGDTAAALVGAIGALYSDVTLAHVEAGLRSGDPEMREERNRIMVDAASHHLFAYTAERARHLEAWQERRGSVHQVGNTTVDLVEEVSERLVRPLAGTYLYVTLHRKELTDRPHRLVRVLNEIASLREMVDQVVLPVHPRTGDVLRQHGVDLDSFDGITVLPPLNPMDSLAFVKFASVVLTDSGCVQEEAHLLRTPCVTVRANTERPETLIGGGNVVTGFAPGAVRATALQQLNMRTEWVPSAYGGPGVGQRINDVLLDSDVAVVKSSRTMCPSHE